MRYSWPSRSGRDFKNTVAVCGVCNLGVLLECYDSVSQEFPDLVQYSVPFPDDRFRIMNRWPDTNIGSPNSCPENVARFYEQGSENLARESWDASGAMFRKALDVATKNFNPALKSLILFKRIEKLFELGLITEAMRDWSHEIRLDGNEAIHGEDPETEEDAKATQKFTEALLTYMYSLPAMVEENRAKRRG